MKPFASNSSNVCATMTIGTLRWTRVQAAGLVTLGILIGSTMIAQAKDAALSSFRWKNRVLVVVARNQQDADLRAQRRIFEQHASGMAERQIVLIEAAGDDERSRDLRRQFGTGEEGFQVVLVGKDGNAAVSARKPLRASELFDQVDAMPMRRDEMRRDGR